VQVFTLVAVPTLVRVWDAVRCVSFKRAATAFTLVEVLVVIAVIGLLLLMAVRTGDNRPTRAPITQCANNLKQIGLGLYMFAADHGGQFPPQVSVTNGGSMEFVGRGSPAAHFQTLSNEMAGPYLKVWICPSDTIKKPATNYAAFDDRNVSYFLSMDAAPAATSTQFIILAGDRHLGVGGRPVRPGLFPLTTNSTLGWTRELHGDSARSPGGNVLFVDGHVEFLRRDHLLAAARGQGLATNLLAVP